MHASRFTITRSHLAELLPKLQCIFHALRLHPSRPAAPPPASLNCRGYLTCWRRSGSAILTRPLLRDEESRRSLRVQGAHPATWRPRALLPRRLHREPARCCSYYGKGTVRPDRTQSSAQVWPLAGMPGGHKGLSPRAAKLIALRNVGLLTKRPNNFPNCMALEIYATGS